MAIKKKKKFAGRPARESCFYGINSCRAILTKRPRTVRKLIVAIERALEYRDLIRLANEARIPVGHGKEAELDKISETKHHQGICVFAADYVVFEPREVAPDLAREPLLLFLDGVGNPHNLGAILRTAAHFGLRYILGGEDLPRLSPAAARTAEGAGEHVRLVRAPDARALLETLKREGRKIVAASLGERATALQVAKLPAKTVLVMGSEVEGIREEILALADQEVTIAGSGSVQSLNVSVSTGIFLHEWSRQQRTRP